MNTTLEWFKSSYSTDEGGACLEVAYQRPKHSPRGEESAVHIRDSKNPTGPILTLAPAAWAAFTPYAAD
ncbi:DUF397 domain-containing protein [Streptomyces sp. NPDC050509]|uniref:DUF397 domain-containing protein n=1 Tax=Streptomyces sp. NPDC050509 TaxID=3365620 RepID=UPI0037AADEDC